MQAGISPSQISQTCAGVTGAGRPEIARVMQQLLASVVGGEVEIGGDVEIAFEDAFGQGPGVLVIAGTGAIAYGRNSHGEIARAGGWGCLVSDEGSGSWIGLEAVRAVLRAKDHGENLPLLDDLAAGLGANDFDDFIVSLNATPGPDFSILFPLVLSAADRGDDITSKILDRGGRELARMAETVANRLFADDSCAVAIHGGVFTSSDHVKSSFERELKVRYPNASYVNRMVDPARGALQCARKI